MTLKLDRISAEPPDGMTEEKAGKRFEGLGKELFDLQDAMWGAKLHSVLVVLQGRDAAGKDGTIKHVVGALNPRGVKVTSFGAPSTEEREHDFLWRVHRVAPRLGEFAIFNRSHYEDVLIVRVHELVKKALWKTRYDSINAFETLLAEHGCIILKYFLHISKEEQEERLLAREKDPTAAWKINVDEAMFLGGLPKGEFLREFEPDFFFDDQTRHVAHAALHVPAGHVAAGIANVLN